MNGPIYEPKGRAREYSPLALNLYSGCPHGCRHCYVPAIVHKSRAAFHATSEPREGIIEALKRQLEEEEGRVMDVGGRMFGGGRVLLCFTSDPYPREPVHIDVTRAALDLLSRYEVPFTVLTKGGMNAARDFHLYGEDDQFAISLSSLRRDYWREWEPRAAHPWERLEALSIATREYGIATWVSIEPVHSLQDTLEVMRAVAPWADEVRIGPDNHSKARRDAINWKDFDEQVRPEGKYLRLKVTYKQDLKELVEGEGK